jgi:hypothetical protein
LKHGVDERKVLISVTHHAAERYLQRVSGAALDPRPEIAGRVGRAWAADRVTTAPPEGAGGARGSVYVTDCDRPDLVYVCRWDRPRHEVVVVTLWETGESAAVPRRYTDELRRLDRRTGLRGGRAHD